MKWGLSLCLGILVLWSLLALVQLWWMPLSEPLFIKISLSALVLLISVRIAMSLIRDYLVNKKLLGRQFMG